MSIRGMEESVLLYKKVDINTAWAWSEHKSFDKGMNEIKLVPFLIFHDYQSLL